MSERRFTDEEVALILREASEVQEQGRGTSAAGGLTLPQLKEIAAEVGLDPAHIEAAALRIERRRPAAPSPVLGTPATPEFTRDLPGELSQEDFAELVTTIRRVLGRRGITEAQLGALEWRAQDAVGGRYVSVLPRGGRTRIHVFANFRDALFSVFVGGGAAVLAGVAVILGATGVLDGLGPGVIPLSALIAFPVVRAFWRVRYRKETEAMAELAEALDEQVRELLASRGSSDAAVSERTAPSPAPPSRAPSPP